jgi:hypothetical protein
MGETCDLTKGSVAVKASKLASCNGTTVSVTLTKLHLFGKTTSYSVAISGSTVEVHLTDVEISASTPIAVSNSDVTFVLSGANSLKSTSLTHAGLECQDSSAITLRSTLGGSLTAAGGSSASGIGTGASGTCDSITIADGAIAASGGTGIGAGSGSPTVVLLGGGSSKLNQIVIQGGTIRAVGALGAGIGAGYAYGVEKTSASSTVGLIAIGGGNVTASSTEGAGIGAGSAYALDKATAASTVTSLAVTGGTVSGTGYQGAGIGAGAALASETFTTATSTVTSLTISNGRVTGTGSSGAGIGAGAAECIDHANAKSAVTSLTIKGGQVSATGEDGAGIGAGYAAGDETASYATSIVGTLTISNGVVTASARNGAGIGAGYGFALDHGNGESTVTTIAITNGTVTASASGGAGIGSASGYALESLSYGTSSVGSIAITNGVITAKGGDGAGIGIGHTGQADHGVGQSTVANISFLGKVDLTVDCDSTHRPISAGAIRFTGASVRATTASLPLLGAKPVTFKGSDIVFLYRRVTSDLTLEPLSGLGHFIQVGDVTFPSPATWTVTVEKADFKQSFLLDSAVVKSFTKSVGGTGDYEINVKAVGSNAGGALETFEGDPEFKVTGDGVTFIYGARLPRAAAVAPVIRELPQN